MGKSYLDSCYNLLQVAGVFSINKVYLDTDKSDFLISENKFNEALKLLANCAETLENLSPNIKRGS